MMEIETEFLKVLLVALCWVWGFNYTFKTDEIFGKIGDLGRKKLPDWFITPLYDCPICMSSAHGTGFYLVFLQDGFILWGVFIFALCGASAIVDKLDNK